MTNWYGDVACTYIFNADFGHLLFVSDHESVIFPNQPLHHRHCLPDHNPTDCGISNILC